MGGPHRGRRGWRGLSDPDTLSGVTFVLSIYDLFTYAIPGFLQLSFFCYLGLRLDLIDVSKAANLPGAGLIVAGAVFSYLAGHLVYAAAMKIDNLLPIDRKRSQIALNQVMSRLPEGANPPPTTDVHILYGYIELRDKEVAAEIGRLRAGGLMLRSATVPAACALVAALVELALWNRPALAAAAVILFAIALAGFSWQGNRLRIWAGTKTYEVYYWLAKKEES
jgi:hypothetical protein